jgi:glycosyltransferase involved in cell wall biosynthesis
MEQPYQLPEVMKMNKFLIILPYYDRPKIVLNALESIMKLDYDNFEVSFIDDGSSNLGEPIVREFCNPIIDKFKFKYINNTIEEKKQQGGSIHGKYMNESIIESDADAVIILCDDDALFSNYLTNLNDYFNSNPNSYWCYSHVKFYDPETQHYSQATEVINNNPSFNTSNLNHYTTPISPSCKVDASQVVFRREAFVKSNIWFPYPQTQDCDRFIFEKMINHWGLCNFLGEYGQYKGWFENQLGVKIKNNREKY